MRFCCVFLVPWWPGGYQGTTQRRACICRSAAHHAAGAAVRALRDKIDADRRHERQRATSMRTHVQRCISPRGRPTIDDRRWQGPPECAHANASDTTTPPQQPAVAAARYTIALSTTHEDTSASKRGTPATIRSTGSTHSEKKRRSNQRRA